jgi:hypothetical protein
MKSTCWKFILFGLLVISTLNAYADWQCYVADKGGHTWTSTGMTEERANAIAFSFCNAYSPNASSCHLSNCETKQ